MAIPERYNTGYNIGVGGAVVRGGKVIMAHHDTVIRAEDHVIVFVTDKKNLPRVERMFQVGARFM